MLPSDLNTLTSAQRLIVEQAFVLSNELDLAVGSAPEGQVIDRCESVLLGLGRDFLRRVLESALQSNIDCAEKKTASLESVLVERPDRTRAEHQEP